MRHHGKKEGAAGLFCSDVLWDFSKGQNGGQCPPYIVFSSNSRHPCTISLAASGRVKRRLPSSMRVRDSGSEINFFTLAARTSPVKSLFKMTSAAPAASKNRALCSWWLLAAKGEG